MATTNAGVRGRTAAVIVAALLLAAVTLGRSMPAWLAHAAAVWTQVSRVDQVQVAACVLLALAILAWPELTRRPAAHVLAWLPPDEGTPPEPMTVTWPAPRPDPYSLTGVAVALAELKTKIRDELAESGLVIGSPDPAGGLLLLAWMELALEHHVELMGKEFVREHVNDVLEGHSVEAVVGAFDLTVRSAEA